LLCPERYLRTGAVHRLLYAAARRARRILCPSHAAAADVVDHLGVPVERVDVVPEGVDPRFAPGARGDLVASPYVLFVGGLDDADPRKDVGGLIDAFGRWARAGDRPERLVLAGRTGPATAALRRRAEAAGAPTRPGAGGGRSPRSSGRWSGACASTTARPTGSRPASTTTSCSTRAGSRTAWPSSRRAWPRSSASATAA